VLSYPVRDGVPATIVGEVPPGFRSSERSRDVGDASVFDAMSDAVLTWGLQRAARVRLTQASPRAEVGALVEGTVTKGLAGLVRAQIRCEVVGVVDEPHRRGFAYGTVEGHVLAGEEAFLVELVDGRTIVTVRQFSRPARWLARLPGARVVQRRINARYLDGAELMARELRAS